MTPKGYFVSAGFKGLVDGRYILFACESDYYDYILNEGENHE